MYAVKVIFPEGISVDDLPVHTRDFVIAGSKHEAKHFINHDAKELGLNLINPKVILDHKIYGVVNSNSRVHLVGTWAMRRNQAVLFNHCSECYATMIDYTRPLGLFMMPSVKLIKELAEDGQLGSNSRWGFG